MTASDTASRPTPTIPTPVVVIVCAVGLAALFWHVVAQPAFDSYGLLTNGVDAKVYRGGAAAVWHQTPLYDEPVYRNWWFTYPPFAALMMLPLALMSQARAIDVLQVTGLIGLFGFVALTLRALGFRSDARFWLTAVAASAAATLLEPVHTTIWNGQVNLVLAVLVVGCLTLPTGRWRGVGVGLAAGIKLTPIFFTAYLLITRRFRAAATLVAAFAATVVIGLVVLRGQAWRYWTQVGQTSYIGVESAPMNQSIQGLPARLDLLEIWHTPSWLWAPLGIGVGSLGLYAAWRLERAGVVMAAITMVGMTACAVSPFSWGHHWIWMVPLLLLALVHAALVARRDRPLTWLWWAAPAAIVVATLAWRVQIVYDGRLVWRSGSFRVFWDPAAHGWEAAGAAVGSASYLIVYGVALAVVLWWTGRDRRSARSGPAAQRDRRPILTRG